MSSTTQGVREVSVFRALFLRRKVFNLLKWQNKSFLKSN